MSSGPCPICESMVHKYTNCSHCECDLMKTGINYIVCKSVGVTFEISHTIIVWDDFCNYVDYRLVNNKVICSKGYLLYNFHKLTCMVYVYLI